MKKILTIILTIAAPLLSLAQTDSVWVEGRVTDAATGQPENFCEVQLFQESELKAVAFCDNEGYYSIGWMPAGIYALSVISQGTSLFYAELPIRDNAMVNIALVHDTARIRALAPAVVTERKHGLGDRLITSPDDPRLWNFNNNPELADIGPAGSSCGNCMGADYFSSPGHLAGQRPRWLDAPFTKKVKSTKNDKKQKKDKPK